MKTSPTDQKENNSSHNSFDDSENSYYLNQKKKHHFTEYKDFCAILDAKQRDGGLEDLGATEEVNVINKKRLFSINSSDYASPIEFFSSAKSNSKKSEKSDRSDLFYAQELMNKGYHNYKNGNYYGACLAYKEALHIRENNSSVSSNLADTYNNLGICYHKLGLIENALICYRNALDMRMIISKSTHNSKIADSYGNLGSAFLGIKDTDTASKCFANAVYIRKIVNKFNHFCSSMVISYHQFGGLSLAIEDYNYAKIFLESALYVNISINKTDPFNSSIATSFHNLGILNLNIGIYSLAKKCFLEELKILINLHGNFSNHPDIAYLYGTLGLMDLENKQYDEGLDYIQISLKMCNSANMTNHIDMTRTLYDGLLESFLHNNNLNYTQKSQEFLKKISDMGLESEVVKKIIFLNTQFLDILEQNLQPENDTKFQDVYGNIKYKYAGDICFTLKSSTEEECQNLLNSSQEFLNKATLWEEMLTSKDQSLETFIIGDNGSSSD